MPTPAGLVPSSGWSTSGPADQEKDVKFSALMVNCVIFHNTVTRCAGYRPRAGRWNQRNWPRSPQYLTEHIKGFAEYSTHELAVTPDAYETRLDVDFSEFHPAKEAA
ncbi:hypothetical protein [Streptomyces sp. NPDC058240]|uniref:hypothetical protein n=1 Tax=Streptomyces sp. NPDC058240 TaxID=3346396 RepID=UPI0036E09EFE